jgi:predicted DNA-binding transcriptional regulator AlpA
MGTYGNVVATMPDVAPDKWLDINEAVTYLRSKGADISRATLYSNVSRYKLPKSYKIGRALRFKIADLDDWVDSITRER